MNSYSLRMPYTQKTKPSQVLGLQELSKLCVGLRLGGLGLSAKTDRNPLKKNKPLVRYGTRGCKSGPTWA